MSTGNAKIDVVGVIRTPAADDTSLAIATLPSTSTGVDEKGIGFERPGRATIVFRPNRRARTPAWLATHTHLSLIQGTHLRTFGKPHSLE